ncbi:MAG: DUF1460 domain-containing protein [Desulfuromonadales bacterium]|nr:DUF1460 domain-containing protein [Desulfuromonadales bacterium]
MASGGLAICTLFRFDVPRIFACWLASVLLAYAAVPAAADPMHQLDLGNRTRQQWDQLLEDARRVAGPQQRIALLSSAFLQTPYRENSLIGGPGQSEVLVIDLSGVDCFTLLDYVEAFRRSSGFSDVLDNLPQVRYRQGHVAYRQRNHFFSDWQQENSRWIEDATAVVGGERALTVRKELNRKQDGRFWLEGIPVVVRDVSFIPSARVDSDVLDALQTGDYLGIYSEQPGLDVSHTGIIIRTSGSVLFRHASSRKGVRRVVDSELHEYLQGKPGILVYRPR